MDVMVKVKFNASRQRIESYENNKYLVYLEGIEESSTNSVLISMLSKYLGVPIPRVLFKKTDFSGDKVFELS